MKTMKELREELTQMFVDLKDGKMDIKDASELNNTAGKIINTVRTQLEYHKLKKDEPKIDFLNCN